MCKLLYSEMVDIFVCPRQSFQYLKTLKLRLYLQQMDFLISIISKFLAQRSGIRCYFDLFQYSQDEELQQKALEMMNSLSFNKLKGVRLLHFTNLTDLSVLTHQNRIKYLDISQRRMCETHSIDLQEGQKSPRNNCLNIQEIFRSSQNWTNLRRLKLYLPLELFRVEDFCLNLSGLDKLVKVQIITEQQIFPHLVALPKNIIDYEETYQNSHNQRLSTQDLTRYKNITKCQRQRFSQDHTQ